MRNAWKRVKCDAGDEIMWTDCVKSVEVLQIFIEESNILHA